MPVRNTAPPAPRQPYAPNPNGRCRRCKQKGHGYPDCTVTDDAEAARLYAAWEGTTAPTATNTQGITASNVAAVIHFLACCVQLSSPKTQSEPGAGREGRSSSEDTQVHQPGSHNCDCEMPGATRPGESRNHKELRSERVTSSSKRADVMSRAAQQTNEPESWQATRGSSNETLNKRDDINILGAVPLRWVPCSNTERPGFDSPRTHQVDHDQATQTDAGTPMCGISVTETTPSQGGPATQEQETTAVAAVSVAIGADIQECERMWRTVHTLMSDTAHPAEVQEAADTALELTSQVWHFEPSGAIEAVVTKIEKRSPLSGTDICTP